MTGHLAVGDYSATPGDSVKLVGKANPDNVLYGKLLIVDEVSWEIVIDGAAGAGEFFLLEEHWTITPWARPVTFKPFAVVQLPEGWNQTLWSHESNPLESSVISRSGENYWTPGIGDSDVAALLNHGAEILFAGVDPPGVDDA